MKPTVLVIDDFASVRLYHVSFLERHGYRCLEAGTGEDALKLLDEESIDLVVLDLVMPAMDGATLFARLRALPKGATIPVLVITSEQSLAQEQHLTTDPLVRVLNKPVLPSTLLQNVQRALSRSPTCTESS